MLQTASRAPGGRSLSIDLSGKGFSHSEERWRGLDGEERRITDIEIRKGRWYSGDHCFTGQQKEQLTQKTKTIMGHDRGPRTPAAISIQECQEAIEIAGGIRILLRGEERLITEVRTAGGGNTRWFSGGLRFTVTEQHRLTRLARAIINQGRKTKR